MAGVRQQGGGVGAVFGGVGQRRVPQLVQGGPAGRFGEQFGGAAVGQPGLPGRPPPTPAGLRSLTWSQCEAGEVMQFKYRDCP